MSVDGMIEHWTIWLMPDSEWPFCVERGISERQIDGVERVEVVRADQLAGAVEALEQIADAVAQRQIAQEALVRLGVRQPIGGQ